MMLANPWFNNSKFKCVVCLNPFVDPMIGSNGMVCCRKCIDHANKKYIYTKWYKCQLFDDLCLLSHIRVDINLYRIIEDPMFMCTDDEEAMQILDMIDTENYNRIKETSIVDNILVKVFANHGLVKHIAQILSDTYKETKKMWQGSDNWNFIHYICRFGTFDLIQSIIDNFEFDLNVCNNGGIYPIHIVSCKSNLLKSLDQVAAIRLFVAKKINLNVSNNEGLRPIHLLLGLENNFEAHDQYVVAKMMTEQKVEMNVQNKDCHGPLHYLINNQVKMIKQHRFEIIAKIVGECDLDMNENESIIHLVCSCNNNFSSHDQYKLMSIIIENKISMYVKNKNGQCPVHHFTNNTSNLTSSAQLNLIELMIHHKIDLNVADNNGITPVHQICSDMNKLTSVDQLSAIQLLINSETTIDFNKPDNNMFRPIHYIVSEKNHLSTRDQVRAIEKMVKLKCIDFDACDKFGKKPIHYVTSNLNHLTAQYDQLSVIKLITTETTDMNSMDVNGMRPIHNVTSNCNNMGSIDQFYAIRFLVFHGVDLNVVDSNGRRPIHNISSDCNNLFSQHQLNCLALFSKKKIGNNFDVDLEVADSNGFRPIHYITSDINKFSSIDQIKALRILINRNVDIEAVTHSGWKPIHFMTSYQKSLSTDDQIKGLKTLILNGVYMDAKITAISPKFIGKNEGMTPMELVSIKNFKNGDFQPRAIRMLKNLSTKTNPPIN